MLLCDEVSHKNKHLTLFNIFILLFYCIFMFCELIIFFSCPLMSVNYHHNSRYFLFFLHRQKVSIFLWLTRVFLLLSLSFFFIVCGRAKKYHPSLLRKCLRSSNALLPNIKRLMTRRKREKKILLSNYFPLFVKIIFSAVQNTKIFIFLVN